jgi:hypothetical protein
MLPYTETQSDGRASFFHLALLSLDDGVLLLDSTARKEY